MKNPLRVYVLSAERTICEQEMLKTGMHRN